MKRLLHIFDVADGIEGAIILLLGTALFVALVGVLPVILTWQLFASGQPLYGIVFLAVILGASLGVARDIRQGRLRLFSIALLAIWLLSVAYVAARVLFA